MWVLEKEGGSGSSRQHFFFSFPACYILQLVTMQWWIIYTNVKYYRKECKTVLKKLSLFVLLGFLKHFIRLQAIHVKMKLFFWIGCNALLITRYQVWETTSVLTLIPRVKPGDTFVERFANMHLNVKLVDHSDHNLNVYNFTYLSFASGAFLAKSCCGQVGDHTAKYLPCTHFFIHLYFVQHFLQCVITQ